MGEALGPGISPGVCAAQGTGYLLGQPGMHLSQLRTRPHPNQS